jgi:diguanylate cyclase (GGDEF)-like protein
VLNRPVPATPVAKARLIVVVFASLGCVPHMFTIAPNLPAGWRAAATAALAGLMLDFVVTFALGRTFLPDPLLTAVLVAVAGRSLADPDAVIGVCLSTLATQSLYGSRRQAFARLVLVLGGFLASTAMSPAAHARELTWHSGPVLGLVPFIGSMGLLMVGLHVLLIRLQQAAARDAVLARAGQRLLNRTDLAEVRAVARAGLAQLAAAVPGQDVVVARVRAGQPEADAAVLTGREVLPPLPAGCLDGIDPAAGAVVRLAAGPAAALDELAGSRRQWWGLGLAGTDGEWYLLLGVDRRPDPGLLDALRTLVTQWSIAEAGCRAHAELTFRAHRDELTALPNRRLFFDRLAVARDGLTGADRLVLMLVDLDDFKQVNDGFGHAAGDALLVEVAARLAAEAGPAGVAARLGGDEFAVLLTGVTDDAEADRIAARLCERLREPVRTPEGTLRLGASIGVATGTAGLTAGDLMRCADIAMYSAKAKGKSRVERFTETQHGNVAELRRLEEHLAHAIERDEISLHYQPYVDLRTEQCLGVEALARWQHATLGAIPPATFIPLASRMGHLVPLGRHVLRTACRQLAAWRADPAMAGLRMSVNVGASQLYDPSFAETVRQALDDAGLPPDRLILEITETDPVDVDRVRAPLTALAGLGVRIALDDFGTGYASFAALRSFPVHQLKIDRGLIVDAEAVDSTMLRLAAATGEALSIMTVAEGVETEQQAAAVRSAGIPAAQGYLYARPMPADDCLAWLVEARGRAGADRGVLGRAG